MLNFSPIYANSYNGLLQLCREIDTNTTALIAWADWVERTFTGFDCFNFGYYDRVDLARNTEWNQPGTDLGGEPFQH